MLSSLLQVDPTGYNYTDAKTADTTEHLQPTFEQTSFQKQLLK